MIFFVMFHNIDLPLSVLHMKHPFPRRPSLTCIVFWPALGRPGWRTSFFHIFCTLIFSSALHRLGAAPAAPRSEGSRGGAGPPPNTLH